MPNRDCIGRGWHSSDPSSHLVAKKVQPGSNDSGLLRIKSWGEPQRLRNIHDGSNSFG